MHSKTSAVALLYLSIGLSSRTGGKSNTKPYILPNVIRSLVLESESDPSFKVHICLHLETRGDPNMLKCEDSDVC